MECPVCGDAPAEPQAIAADFQNPPLSESLLAVCCTGCGSVYLSPGLPPADRNRIIPAVEPPSHLPAPPRPSGGAGAERVVEVRARGDGPLAEVTGSGRQYDQIVLHDNLEYLSDPRTQLEAIRATLSPNGRVILVLHNLASPGFAVFGGRHWAGYDFPRQRALYPLGAVRRLAEGAGLTVERVRSIRDAGCWVESMHRLLTDWNAPGWLLNRFRPASILASGAFGAMEHLFQWQGKAALLVVSLRANA